MPTTKESWCGRRNGGSCSDERSRLNRAQLDDAHGAVPARPSAAAFCHRQHPLRGGVELTFNWSLLLHRSPTLP